MTLTVNIATLAEVKKIAPLFDAYRQFYQQPADLAAAQDFLRARLQNNESIILWAADAQQHAVGFCQVYPSFCSILAAPIYVLYDLFTVPVARKNGVGKALLEAAYQHALANGIAQLDLTTAKNNYSAQSLYESLGWERDDIFYAYHNIVRR